MGAQPRTHSDHRGWIVPGLTLDGVDGSLARSVQIARFELDRGGWSVKAENVDIELHDWSLARAGSMPTPHRRRLQIDWQSSGARVLHRPSWACPSS